MVSITYDVPSRVLADDLLETAKHSHRAAFNQTMQTPKPEVSPGSEAAPSAKIVTQPLRK